MLNATMDREQPPLSEKEFRRRLLNWHAGQHRPLPWKETKDPYVIWLSEIILQQTRVEQGLPYFRRFVEHYPDVGALAAASLDEVLKHWQGLGYYSRARNLHATARHIAQELNGRFPDTYAAILALKGVGPYTAAAIASFAYDLPHAVVDGNVFRVLARIFGIDTPIDSTQGKKQFAELAGQLLDSARPGAYNQAIMDFGATCCTPKRPRCEACPFQSNCRALHDGRIEALPAKSKKPAKKNRYFHYLVLRYEGDFFLRKRTGKDIWQQLFEFPLIELPHPAGRHDELVRHTDWKRWIGEAPYQIRQVSRTFSQTLSHQHIHARFWTVELSETAANAEKCFLRVNPENLHKFAFPKIIDWYLRDKALYLNLY